MNLKASLGFLAFLLLLLGLSGTSVASAQEGTPSARQEFQITAEHVKPGSFQYGLTRFAENIRLLILSPMPSKKADFYEKLADKRLGELDRVVSGKDVANIETSSTRYFTTIGVLTEYINRKNMAGRRDRIAEKLIRHKMVIEELMPTFNDTTAEWRFLKHDLDYLTIYVSQLRDSTSKEE
jgi:hypothetical protein